MFKSFLISMFILSMALFKFNIFFANLIDKNEWMLIYVYIIIALSLIVYRFSYEVFSDTGSLGKFIFHFFTTLVVSGLILIPFSNLKEFSIHFSIAVCVMLTPIYFIIRKVQQFNRINYSIVDMLNEKLKLVMKNNLLISWLAVGFILAVSLSNDSLNYIVINIFIYFSILVAISLYTRFHLMKNVLSDVMLLILFSGYSLSFIKYKIPDIAYTLAALSYVLLTLSDVIAMVKYIRNPEIFLKQSKVNTLATRVFRENPDAALDYFKYFKNIVVREPFIVYDALFGHLKYIITEQYYIRKQYNYSSELSDKLFHVAGKEIQPNRFGDFFNISQRYLDEHTNIDKYAIFNFGTIQNYMRANHIEYNDLTDDDLKVIEMYQY